jgi:hypothetical protein
MDAFFADDDLVLQQQDEALGGTDGLAQYKDYAKNLLAAQLSRTFN